MTDIRFQRLSPDAVLPGRANTGDAGLDLATVEHVSLAPGERRLVRTGLAVEIPAGHGGLVLPRSGLALKHGVTGVNSPGLIDSGYRGEIGVILLNTDQAESVDFEVGDRIAQLLVVPFNELSPTWAENLEDSDRGNGGFGSSGRS
jgi:dUTP pyrophosphatase